MRRQVREAVSATAAKALWAEIEAALANEGKRIAIDADGEGDAHWPAFAMALPGDLVDITPPLGAQRPAARFERREVELFLAEADHRVVGAAAWCAPATDPFRRMRRLRDKGEPGAGGNPGDAVHARAPIVTYGHDRGPGGATK